MGNALSDWWQFTTIAIEDDLGSERGTGVLVSDRHCAADLRTGDGAPGTVYMITAQHVLGANESEIRETLSYSLCYHSPGPAGLEKKRHRFSVRHDERNWAVHPDPGVDIAVLDLSQWFDETAGDNSRLRFCLLSEVANPTNLTAGQCDAGDDVFVLGYPLRLRQGRTNLPIVRKGVLATSPRRALIDETGLPRRGFLIDGAIMPGSSGSPVIASSKHRALGDLVALVPDRPLLIGVVTEEWQRERRARRNDGGPDPDTANGYANLGFAHSAATVIEAVALLGHHSAQDFLRRDHDAWWTPELGIPEWDVELSGSEVDDEAAYELLLAAQKRRPTTRSS